MRDLLTLPPDQCALEASPRCSPFASATLPKCYTCTVWQWLRLLQPCAQAAAARAPQRLRPWQRAPGRGRWPPAALMRPPPPCTPWRPTSSGRPFRPGRSTHSSRAAALLRAPGRGCPPAAAAAPRGSRSSSSSMPLPAPRTRRPTPGRCRCVPCHPHHPPRLMAAWHALLSLPACQQQPLLAAHALPAGVLSLNTGPIKVQYKSIKGPG